MNAKRERNVVATLGYGVGTGVVFVAIAGVPLQFAYPDAATLWTYGGSFLLGGVVGAVVATVRPPRV